MKLTCKIVINIEVEVEAELDFFDCGPEWVVRTIKDQVEDQVHKSIHDQVAAQHPEFMDAKRYLDVEKKFMAQFDRNCDNAGQHYGPGKNFNREQAREMLAELERIEAKYGLKRPFYIFDLLQGVGRFLQ